MKNPVTGKREIHIVSEAAEIRLGEETKKAIVQEYGLYFNPLVQAYINEVGQKLIVGSDRKDIRYEFVILDTGLVNAFAVPGVVFLTRGILDLIDDEAELAAVMGHEIGHISGFHSVKLIQKSYGYGFLATFAAVAGTLYAPSLKDANEYSAYYETLYRGIGLVTAGFLTGYGREFELEADRSGLRYAILAGYDPEAMISFFKRMRDLEKSEDHDISVFLRTHPRTDDRIKQIKKILGSVEDKNKKHDLKVQSISQILKSTSTVLIDHFEKYQNVVKDLPHKDFNQNGKILKNSYHHVSLNLSLEVPPKWKLEYGHQQSLVNFYSPDGKVQGELQARSIYPTPNLIARSSLTVAGIYPSLEIITSKEWAESIEKNLKLEKRLGRDAVYPAGAGYVATYKGMNRIGAPAFFKTFYLVYGEDSKNLKGIVLTCAAPEDTYLDYLVDIELVLRGLKIGK